MAKKAVKRGKFDVAGKKSPLNTKPATAQNWFAASASQGPRVTFAHGTSDAGEAAFIVGETLGFIPIASKNSPQGVRRSGRAHPQLVDARIKTRKPGLPAQQDLYAPLPFYIDDRAIVPRSYLGEIMDTHFGDDGMVLDPLRVTRVLDLCTGSGCLAILAVHRFPHAHVDAVDLSAEALQVARRNVADHKLGRRITLHQGDLFVPLGDNKYDLIISNPPYVDAQGMANLPQECRHEPAMAFDGGADGIAIVRRIIDAAPRFLKPGGGLLCEVGRCKPALEQAYPRTPFLWLDTEESEGEVFWLGA